MLHYIRNLAQGWVAWFIVGLISIPFALWGVNSYLNRPSKVIVAKVNGEPISQSRLQQALEQYRNQMRNMLEGRFDPALFESEHVKREVLNGLIEQMLIINVANESGLYISDAEIANMIKNTQVFQRDGQFDSEYYAMVLNRAGYTPLRYEKVLRRDLLQRAVMQTIQRTGIVTENQVKDIVKIEKQKRELAYGTVPVSDFIDLVSVEDEAVKAHYNENQSAYMEPEQIMVNYVELSVADLAKDVEVNDAALKQFYLENQDNFVEPEQRRASHILIEGHDEEAMAAIKDIQQRLQTGEDFAELAKVLSQDYGSAQQGGDLGFFQRDMMDPAFEDAAFALEKVGDISGIVTSEFGYHLIKLTGIEKPQAKTFAEVSAEVEVMYRQQQAEKLFFDKAEQLANISYENPDNLDVVSETLGLQVKVTEMFTRQGGQSDITSDRKVIDAAFSYEVLEDELNSEVIELSENRLLVIHKNEHKQSTLLAFESVVQPIRESLKYDKASEMAEQKGQQMLAQLKSGTATAQELFTNWQAKKIYQRNSDGIDTQVLQHAFAMPKSDDKPEYSGFSAGNGDYIVLQLSTVEEGDLSTTSDDDLAVVKGQLSRLYADAEAQAFVEALKAAADIEISGQALN